MVAAGGYKKTEVGVVPADWRVLPLGAISDTSSGTTPPRSLYSRYFKNGVFAWVKTLDLSNHAFVRPMSSLGRSRLKMASFCRYHRVPSRWMNGGFKDS